MHILFRTSLIVLAGAFLFAVWVYHIYSKEITLSVVIQIFALLSIVATVSGIVFKDFIERWYKRNWEADAIRGELIDLSRHLSANIGVINTLLDRSWPKDEIPRTLHIDRFHILPTSVLASEQTYRLSDPLAMRSVHQFQLFLRNIGVDIKEAARIAEANDISDLKEFLSFLRARFEMGLEAIEEVALILNALERLKREKASTSKALDATIISFRRAIKTTPCAPEVPSSSR